MVRIEDSGYVTKHYEVKDKFVHVVVDVVLYQNRLYSVTIRGGRTIELYPYDIRLIQEVLKRHPLPPLPSLEEANE